MKLNVILKHAAVCAIAIICSIGASAQSKTPQLLDPADFQTVIDGKQVGLYTITNGTVTVQVTNYCGYIVGIFAPDKDGNYDNVVGHNDNIQMYQGFSRNPCGASLGRYANRIGGAKFTLDGVEYELTKNNGQNILHGGSHGFDHTIWDVVKVTGNSVVFACTLADGLDGFPGNLTTTLTFSVTKDNGVSISYKAKTDKPTVCNMSHHAYFNLDGFHGGNILGHVLQLNSDKVTEVDNALIPTGKFIPVEGTVYDFRTPVKLSDRQITPQPRPTAPAGGAQGVQARPAPQPVPEGMVRNYDMNFCLVHKSAKKIESVANLYSPESGRNMEVLNNHPGMQIYSGNTSAIAMESQMYPDSPNHPDFPSTVLRPGKTYKHTVIYKFSVK